MNLITNQDRILQNTTLRANNKMKNAYSALSPNSNVNEKQLSIENEEAQQRQNADTFNRIGSTTADVFGSVIAGASKSLEGMVDFAVNVTGMFGNQEFKDKVKDFVDDDWTQEHIKNSDIYQELTKNSYLKDASETVQKLGYGIAEGVGGMLPSIALTFVTGGLGASAAVAQGVGLGAMGIGAAGSSTEEAYNEGGDYTKSTAYGFLSGALEVATEKMFGGLENVAFGKGVFDEAVDSALTKFTRSVGSANFVKFLADIGEEGIEEVVSEVVTPYLQRATYDPNADNATMQEVIEAGIIGSLTAMVMDGTNVAVRNTTKKGKAMTALTNAEEAQKYYEVARKSGDTETAQIYLNEMNKYNQSAEYYFKDIKEERRSSYLNEDTKNTNRKSQAEFLNARFKEDGSLRDGIIMSGEEISNKIKNIVNNANYENITSAMKDKDVSLISKELNIKEDDIKKVKLDEAQIKVSKEADKMNMPIMFVNKEHFAYDDNGEKKYRAGYYDRVHDIIVMSDKTKSFSQLDQKTSHEITAHYICKSNDVKKAVLGAMNNVLLEEASKGKSTLVDSIAYTLKKRGINENSQEYSEEALGAFIELVYNGENDGITLLHKLSMKNKSALSRFAESISNLRKGIQTKHSDFYKEYRKQLKGFEKIVQTAIETRDEQLIREAVDNQNNKNIKESEKLANTKGFSDEETDDNVAKNGEKEYNLFSDEDSPVDLSEIKDYETSKKELDTYFNDLGKSMDKYDESLPPAKRSQKALDIVSNAENYTEFISEYIDGFKGKIEHITEIEILKKYLNDIQKTRKDIQDIYDSLVDYNDKIDVEGEWENPQDSWIEKNNERIDQGQDYMDDLENSLYDLESTEDELNEQLTRMKLIKEKEKKNAKQKAENPKKEQKSKTPKVEIKENATNEPKIDNSSNNKANDNTNAQLVVYDAVEGKISKPISKEMDIEKIKAIANTKNGKVFNYIDVESMLIDIMNSYFGMDSAIATLVGKKLVVSKDIKKAFIDATFETISFNQNVNSKEFKKKISDAVDILLKSELVIDYMNSVEKVEGKKTIDIEDIENDVNSTYESFDYQEIKTEIINNILSSNVKSRASIVSTLEAKISQLKDKIFNVKQIAKMQTKLWKSLKRLGAVLDSDSTKPINKDIAVNPLLKKIVKSSTGSAWYTGTFSKEIFRKNFFDKFKLFYNKNNTLLTDYFPSDNGTGVYDTRYSTINDSIDFLNDYYYGGKYKKSDYYTIEYLENVSNLIEGAYKLLTTFDNVDIEGKVTSIREASESAVTKQIANSNYNPFNKDSIPNSKSAWLKNLTMNLVDPRTKLLNMVNYDESNELYKAFESLTKGQSRQVIVANELYEKLNEVLTNKYKKELKTKKIKIEYISDSGKTETLELGIIPAIFLRNTLRQEHSHKGVQKNGFVVGDDKITHYKVKDIQATIDSITSQYSNDDLKFDGTICEIFNSFKSSKTEMDSKLYGVTNVDYQKDYFPIKRLSLDRDSNIALSNMENVMSSIFEISFNQNRITGASGTLVIPDDLRTVRTYIDQMSKYVTLADSINTFGKVYGKTCVIKDSNGIEHKTSMKALFEQQDKNASKYFGNLLQDIFKARGDGNKIFGKLRGAYAKSALALNPKVMVSQLASLGSALSYIDVKYLAKGMINGHPLEMTKEMISHSEYAKARYSTNSNEAVQAEGLLEHTDVITNKLTIGITACDKTALLAIWNASKAQIQGKNSNIKVGSKEYWNKVNELFEKTCRETQPNYSSLERSAFMRDPREIAKVFAMFKSVGMKNASLLVKSIQKCVYIQERLKANKKGAIQLSQTELLSLEKESKESLKDLARKSASVISANSIYVIIGMLFKKLLGKKEKDKEGNEITTIEAFSKNFASSMVSMFPIVGDIFDFFAYGYDIENFSYSMISDVLTSVQDSYDIISDYSSGEEVSEARMFKTLRNSIYSLSSILGIPTRNVNNFIAGLTRTISPSTGYKYDNLFNTNPSYKSDLQDAIDNGDEKKASTIFDLMMASRGVETSSATTNTIKDLYFNGYNVLPKTLSKNITYNNENYTLTRADIKRFKGIYDDAEIDVQNLQRYALFKSASDDVKAKSIKMVYDFYYTLAVKDYVGDSSLSKIEMFAKVIPIEKLAIIIKECQSVSSKNKKYEIMKIINRQGLTNAQKYMVLGYLGYSNDSGYSQVSSTISSLGLDKDTRKQFVEYCGYDVA